MSLRLVAAVIAAIVSSACVNSAAVLTQLLEARRLASDVHVEFTKASEAANRAVMSESDDAAAAAVEEAKRAKQLIERDVEALRSILQSLGYRDDLSYLDRFKARYDEYRRLDDEILSLAVENTNVKAQRLSFGAARDAVAAFQKSLAAAVHESSGKNSCGAEAMAGRARIAVLEIQALHASHIAESDDAAMTRMEAQMEASAKAARQALEQLKASIGPGPRLAAASAALDRFMAVNSEIVALSRRNSNVRSLALSLGRKRTIAAACEDQLRALEQALAKHEFVATR